MAYFWIDRVLPSLIAGTLAGAALGVMTYFKLHFEEKWPYWGRHK